jgi:hypothetical protein
LWFPVRRYQPASDLPPRPNPSPQPPVWVPDMGMSDMPMRPRNNNAVFEPQSPFVPPPLQQPVWVQEQVWDVPPMRRNDALLEASRNNALLDTPPPVEPPPPPADAREGDIEARFQDALRRAADLTSVIDQLRRASTGREIGPGHNQGPSLEDLDQVDDLIALLKDEGPRVKIAVDARTLIEQTEKVKRLPERIWSLLAAAGLFVLGVGAREVTKDLTAPLWDDVAHRIVDLCHAIEVWVSLLPPM